MKQSIDEEDITILGYVSNNRASKHTKQKVTDRDIAKFESLLVKKKISFWSNY